MGRILVEIPRVGLVMETARVTRWLKAVGDAVAPGEPLVEVETEKSLVEIEASTGGRLVEIVAESGAEVAVGAPLAWLEDGETEAPPVRVEPRAAPEVRSAETTTRAAATGAQAERQHASPAARKRAAELGVDLARVQGSGPGGRILIEDVDAAAPRGARAAGPEALHEPPSARREPLSALRRAVARAVTLANATVPQFNVARAVDWTRVHAARKATAAGAARPSLNDYLLKACARALVELPGMNGVFVGDPASPDAHIRRADGTHVGLVVAAAGGMRVPVFHRVERMSLAELAARRAAAVERAREGRMREDEAGGATFTVSNLGAQGPDRFTALLGPHESGILAVGRERLVPVVRDGAVVALPVSELTLTVDHRVADGKLAADFLARLVEILEHWSTADEAAHG